MRVCIVGACGNLDQYMVELALDRGHGVVAAWRQESVANLAAFDGRIAIVPVTAAPPGWLTFGRAVPVFVPKIHEHPPHFAVIGRSR